MWDRAYVKSQGKANFKKNYWNSVLVAFIYSLFFVASGSTVRSRSGSISKETLNDPDFMKILMIILAIVGVLIVFGTILKIFVFNPLEVGCNRFFLVNQLENATIGEVGFSYKNNYMNAVSGIFLRDLITVLGYMLLVVPGIILSYSYRLVPYILADDPQIKGADALRLSRKMMNGHKLDAFVFDLSFIGWYLLGIITCGIAVAFYVRPYKMNADAALYLAIKNSNGYEE
ncbi:putative integral membrane protein [Lachnospiraceae bacterium JC7]|nr:putative integral membrane protein [Lachnospiraceae bacterium JC7]